MTALKVAIVDDDPVTLEILGAILQTEGYHVHPYADADQFLAALERTQPDCVLLDVFMPGCSGLDVLVLIGGMQHRAPIIMISARSDIPTAAAAIEAGAYDFVEKPVAPHELVQRVWEAIRHFREQGGGHEAPQAS
jgi:FixJ family two-component response regulator